METTLKKAEKLLESLAAKSENQTIERAKGLALVAIAKRVSRVASSLEEAATALKSLVTEVTENKQTKDSRKRLGIE